MLPTVVSSVFINETIPNEEMKFRRSKIKRKEWNQRPVSKLPTDQRGLQVSGWKSLIDIQILNTSIRKRRK